MNMKIDFTQAHLYPYASADIRKPDDVRSSSLKSHRNYDGLTIQADKSVSAEQTFQETLSRQISASVRALDSPQKLEQLKEQIQNGSYQPDPGKIADSILLFTGIKEFTTNDAI